MISQWSVVRLKSGGPKMVVISSKNEQFAGKAQLFCRWFDQDGKVNDEWFYEASLVAEETT